MRAGSWTARGSFPRGRLCARIVKPRWPRTFPRMAPTMSSTARPSRGAVGDTPWSRASERAYVPAVPPQILMWLYSAGHTETQPPPIARGVCDEPTPDEKRAGCISGACRNTGGRLRPAECPDSPRSWRACTHAPPLDRAISPRERNSFRTLHTPDHLGSHINICCHVWQTPVLTLSAVAPTIPL